ncbi:helix-turn-helix transcriptional regulator [Brucella pituitosa]|uniref:helix-turn-helix transcriptional regulator n=1 Tax=Brucella pituitosa TaxID=571256 RepID=UPI000C27E07E|nr:helix-turn-helix domain-containing protein [Brucella pituitosa]PJO47188.1 helix-turn-helix domain-containing protein [Brucella pituitosa]
MQKLITGPQVIERYHITPQTLGRWVKDATLGFPKPISIRRRNFWKSEDLDAFEASKQSKAV